MFDLGEITWDTIAALATVAAVVTALIPIWREAQRRKAHARSLRIILCAKLLTLRPSFGKIIQGGHAEYPTAIFTKEKFREVVR